MLLENLSSPNHLTEEWKVELSAHFSTIESLVPKKPIGSKEMSAHHSEDSSQELQRLIRALMLIYDS